MKTFLFLLFGSMSLGAVYLTYYDVGAGEPKLDPHSVRRGSTGHAHYYGK